MAIEQLSGRELNNQRKKARKALLAFLKRLRKAGRTFSRANQYYDYARQLQQILHQYGLDIPGSQTQRLQNALSLTDASRSGISNAVQVLEFELEKVVGLLPAGGVLAPIVIGAAIVIAGGVGLGVANLNANAAQVAIRNDGCNPIPISKGVLPALDGVVGIVGVELPPKPIEPGETANMNFPRIKFRIDASRSATIALKVAGVSVPFECPPDVGSIVFDGTEILGKEATVDMGGTGQHSLVIRCR
jgi:hypothetical protein